MFLLYYAEASLPLFGNVLTMVLMKYPGHAGQTNHHCQHNNNTNKELNGYSDTAIRVIDVNKGEWRAFRVDSVVSFS